MHGVQWRTHRAECTLYYSGDNLTTSPAVMDSALASGSNFCVDSRAKLARRVFVAQF